MANITSIVCYNDSYTFASQGSSTFTFKTDDSINYNPDNYIVPVPPVRGTRKNTIGGSAVTQMIIQADCDGVITFSIYLTKAEINDFYAAKAKLAQWTLTDYVGNVYVVIFDFQSGFVVGDKLRANDRYWCSFKFLVDIKST